MSTQYSNITWNNLTFTGSANKADILGATYAVLKENEKRAANGEPPLPMSNLAELKASDEAVMLQHVAEKHDQYIIQAAKYFGQDNIGPNDRIDLNVAIGTRLQIDGAALADLIADIES